MIQQQLLQTVNFGRCLVHAEMCKWKMAAVVLCPKER